MSAFGHAPLELGECAVGHAPGAKDCDGGAASAEGGCGAEVAALEQCACRGDHQSRADQHPCPAASLCNYMTERRLPRHIFAFRSRRGQCTPGKAPIISLNVH